MEVEVRQSEGLQVAQRREVPVEECNLHILFSLEVLGLRSVEGVDGLQMQSLLAPHSIILDDSATDLLQTIVELWESCLVVLHLRILQAGDAAKNRFRLQWETSACGALCLCDPRSPDRQEEGSPSVKTSTEMRCPRTRPFPPFETLRLTNPSTHRSIAQGKKFSPCLKFYRVGTSTAFASEQRISQMLLQANFGATYLHIRMDSSFKLPMYLLARQPV